MKKTILAHSERDNTHKNADSNDQQTAIPAYLLDRQGQNRAKVLSNTIKQKRKEKAGRYQVPTPLRPPHHRGRDVPCSQVRQDQAQGVEANDH